MAIRDLLLPLIGDATRSTAAAIEKCVAMAAELDAHITALALETEDDALPPTVADVLGAREVVQIEPTARALCLAFDAARTRFGARGDHSIKSSPIARMIDSIALVLFPHRGV